MWKTVIIVVAVLIAGVLVVAALRPDDFSVQRSASIKAPPDRIYPMLVDFRQWPSWSPWEKLDPTMTRTLGGAASGPGASYAWSGSGKVGAGRMEILDATAPAKVSIKLDFIKPFEGHNVTDFTLVPKGEQTEVTWLMHGPAPFVSKLMGLFVDMDKMIGKDFEAGLANLKAASEK
jgi:uncharacterized protein YndB with AHSA1/START domain